MAAALNKYIGWIQILLIVGGYFIIWGRQQEITTQNTRKVELCEQRSVAIEAKENDRYEKLLRSIGELSTNAAKLEERINMILKTYPNNNKGSW